MHKLCNGKVPPLHADTIDDTDKKMVAEFDQTKIKVENLLEQFKFRDALFEVIDLARKGNKYLQVKEPWKTGSQNIDSSRSSPLDGTNAVDNCLHVCLQLCANLAILINPFLPFTAKKMIHMMKVVDKMLDWENAGKTKLLSVGYSLRPPELLFRKIEDKEIEAQIEKLKRGQTASEPAPAKSNLQPATNDPLKSTIQFDDFAKIDLRTGVIVSAEKVEKADKLLKLEIDLGFEKRTIVSGIAMHFKAEEIIGKQVVVVANLAPRKMRGIASNGMILMAEDKEGKLHFVNALDAIEPGASIT